MKSCSSVSQNFIYFSWVVARAGDPFYGELLDSITDRDLSKNLGLLQNENNEENRRQKYRQDVISRRIDSGSS